MLEYSGAAVLQVLCALDLHKAYNSVNRTAMDAIASHLGLPGNGFWMLMTLARDTGPVYITGTLALSAPFYTTRGIKQGCPASPLLFALLLTGLEKRLLCLHSTSLGHAGPAPHALVSYADDIKLFAQSAHGMQQLLAMVSYYVGHLGLSLDWEKTKVLFLRARAQPSSFTALGKALKVVRELKFLGTMVTAWG